MSRMIIEGKMRIHGEEQANEESEKKREDLVLWNDGSTDEDQWVECTVV